MYATGDNSNLYPEQMVYDSEWTENVQNGVPWYNFLTSEPIPEETDSLHGHCTPTRSRTPSNSSSSSVESCYVVLEIQRQRSIETIPGKVEDEKIIEEKPHNQAEQEVQINDKMEQETELKKEDQIENEDEEEYEEVDSESEDNDDDDDEDEEEEEEEEIEEEIEELNFAQVITNNNHDVDDEQVTLPIKIEVPLAQRLELKYQHFISVDEFAESTQPTIQETPNDILFHQAKKMSRFTKRVKAMSYANMKEQSHPISSDDEPLNITKLKTIIRVNEFYPALVSTVEAEQQLSAANSANSDSFRCSTTSLDSIENYTLSLSPNQSRITTFSNLSSRRALNPTQNQRSGPTMGTTTLTRTFAFDRACMEKYGRAQVSDSEHTNNQLTSIDKSNVSHETKYFQRKNMQNEGNLHSENTTHHHPFLNSISTSAYADDQCGTASDFESGRQQTKSPFTPTLNSQSKTPSLMGFMKKCARTIKSEYRLAQNKNSSAAEPTLVEVKYLDGRVSLKDETFRDSFRKTSKFSSSIANRLNRIGLSHKGSTQDLSSTASSFYSSYRKRVVNGFRTFVENNLAEPVVPASSTLPHSRSWQHKSIIELFHERKYRVNR